MPKVNTIDDTSAINSASRIFVIQPALPAYRVQLFSRIAEKFGDRFSVLASRQPELAMLSCADIEVSWLHVLNPMQKFWPGLEWQPGALWVSLKRGDVLVLPGQPRTLSNLALILKAKMIGARVVWWGHYWSSTSRPWRAAIRFELMRLPDAILFYTDQEVMEYSARLGRHPSIPISALNNSIETKKIVALRAPYSSVGRSRDLFFIGRLTPKAELGLLLEALACTSCANIMLDVVGDGDEAARLRERADILGISDRIAWHGAATDEARIAEVANACRAFVYPGAVGLSLLHGLSYGLPAIVHDSRWQHMPEIAAHTPGKNGTTFRQGDVDALAEAISGLLSRSDRLADMSREAIDTTEQTFNAADMAERFIAMIEAVS